jgi:aminopeptidase N
MIDLSVYSWPRATFYAQDNPTQSFDVTVPGGKAKNVLGEAKDVIKFLESLYGPFPYDQVQIAQMSPFLGFGQAPPGFLQLTGEAFMSSSDIASFSNANADFFHEFFGHEMAHQYWAHAIQWSTDEDQWLSESFAEHTAGLYVLALQGKTRFEGKLKEWRDAARRGDPQAPIAWANNLGGPSAGKWRTDLIYNKGPYVVHMLYSQLGHDTYMKAMQALIKKYRFQEITTDQMAQELSKTAGYDLNYFFDQWFRGTGIPTIDYSWEAKQTEDGKYLATVKLSQRDKAKVKVLSVPIFFHFGKDQVVVKNRPMLQAEDVYQLKLPSKPVRVTVDDNKTLLADIIGQGDAAGH